MSLSPSANSQAREETRHYGFRLVPHVTNSRLLRRRDASGAGPHRVVVPAVNRTLRRLLIHMPNDAVARTPRNWSRPNESLSLVPIVEVIETTSVTRQSR